MYLFCIEVRHFIIDDDASFNKTSWQSTTHEGSQYYAMNAVDRNITTCMRTRGIGRTTLLKRDWWKVDLGEIYNIYDVNIVFKSYDSYGTFF